MKMTVIATSEWVNPFKQRLTVPTDNTAGDGGFIEYFSACLPVLEQNAKPNETEWSHKPSRGIT